MDPTVNREVNKMMFFEAPLQVRYFLAPVGVIVDFVGGWIGQYNAPQEDGSYLTALQTTGTVGFFHCGWWEWLSGTVSCVRKGKEVQEG